MSKGHRRGFIVSLTGLSHDAKSAHEAGRHRARLSIENIAMSGY